MPSNPAQDTFIFQPGGVNRRFSEGVPVYTVWAELMADLAASTSPKKTILIDDTITSPIPIPVGTWDLTGVKLTNGRHSAQTGSQTFSLLSIASGAVLTGLTYMEGMAVILSTSIGTPISYTTDTNVVLRDCIFAISGTGVPFWSVSGGATVNFTLDHTAINGSTSAAGAITVSGSSTVVIKCRNDSQLVDDTIYGTGSDTLADLSNDAGSSMSEIQTGFLGSIGAVAPGALKVRVDDTGFSAISGTNVQSTLASIDTAVGFALTASGTGYSPGTPGDWTGSPPADVGSALDRIAAAVAGLLAGTIP